MFLITILLLGLVQGPAIVVRCDFASYNQFALKLIQKLGSPTENLVVAPTVVQMTLAILEHGAQGTTATEIYNITSPVLGDKSQIVDNYQKFVKSLQAKDRDTWYQRSKLIVKESFPIKPDYESFLRENFQAEISKVAIKEHLEEAKLEINSVMYGKFSEDFFTALGSISENTSVILASTARFKAKWTDRAMKPTVVAKEISFYVTPEKNILKISEKNMIKLSSEFRYKDSASLKAQLVEIPYKQGEFQMIIILPHNIFGLTEVESKLLSPDLGKELAQLTETRIDVLIPKFKIETNITLDEALKQMGMNTTFSESADFSGISNVQANTTVIQEAFIEVSTEGSKTTANASYKNFQEDLKHPRTVLCNHPFLYMVVKNKAIVLIGRLAEPNLNQHSINTP